jgi:CubicO group peptidase (beta-lactamase class C family)
MDEAARIVDMVMRRWAMNERAPAVAWGLLRDGELGASGGVGTLRIGEDATPGANSVFRIASMSKSFTGAALMSLVADGLVRLDEPVATYVPAFAKWRGPTADGPPITVRHLVSMESGLPTDDAWADRHLDISQADMEALLEAGAMFTWTPGVRFEYSNLGWGMAGQVVRAVTGGDVQALVTRALLEPLGMSRTTWLRPAHDDIAEPYEWRDDAWIPVTHVPGDGQIAPMGGLWSTVADLARWMRFFIDAYPPRDDVDHGPVPRWARREMQQLRRMDDATSMRPRPDGPARTAAIGYGIGLGIRSDPRLGYVVGHSGGLPGYGSHMRWIPDRGIGLVALSNVTYGNMTSAISEAFDRLADADALPPARTVEPSATFRSIADRAVALANRWSDAAANELFADNVAMDESFERRASEAAAAVARHGDLAVEDLDMTTPTEGDVVVAGGAVKIELALNHEAKVEWWKVVDRARASDVPIVTDPDVLAAIPRCAYVVLRPTGDLVDAFAKWRGEVLDRLDGKCPAMLPTAHATLKAFGSKRLPIADGDEERIVEVVRAWAAETPPLPLRATGLELWDADDEHVPVITLDTDDPLRAAIADLWGRAAEAALPTGYSDHIGADGWRAHLSLCYIDDEPPAEVWEPLRTWTRYAATGDAASTAFEAEVVAFRDGTERRLGLFPFRP